MTIKHSFKIFILGIISVFSFICISFSIAVYSWSYPPTPKPPPSLWIEDREGKPLGAFVSEKNEWYFPLKEEEISPYLFKAIVAVEDHRFYQHHGVDWIGVAAALWQDFKAMKIIRGASTLTMQVEHLRYPKPRTFSSKLIESIRAYQLERKMSKNEILTEYLNRCPLGGNLIGVGAASWRYFGISCRNLSLSQAALLAGLPQSPNRYRPDRFIERALKRRNHVLFRMLSEKMISEQDYARAIEEPIQATWQALPQEKKSGILPILLTLKEKFQQGKFKTSLDKDIQEQLTLIAKQEFEKLKSSQINALSLVLLNTQTSECLASINLCDDANNLDLSNRYYSTGSTLKPFIYAAAFEAGICTPTTILKDLPLSWEGYTPSNFDHTFRGFMCAAEALAQSRNIPAMILLSKIGIARVVGILQSLGFKRLEQFPDRYGLSLAIGGAEASPIELAEAFATLGRGGIHLPVTYIPLLTSNTDTATQNVNPVDKSVSFTDAGDTRRGAPSRATFSEHVGADEWQDPPLFKGPHFYSHHQNILSQKACWQVLNALSDPKRTYAVCPEAIPFNPAWKTGTSSAHKDAWCVAVTHEYTLVTWLGNSLGKGSHELVGQTLAAPLTLKLLSCLKPKNKPWPQIQDEGLAKSIELEKDISKLTISSISSNQKFFLDAPSFQKNQKLPLQSIGGSPHSWRWWFVNGLLIGKTRPEKALFWIPQPGLHEIYVTDETGASAKVNIHVE